MKQRESELLTNGWIRDYSNPFAFLRIIRYYKHGGCVDFFVNRWNPLFWIYLIVMILFAPLYCMFNAYTLRDVFKEIEDMFKEH